MPLFKQALLYLLAICQVGTIYAGNLPDINGNLHPKSAFILNEGQYNDSILYQGYAGNALIRFLENEISYAYINHVENEEHPDGSITEAMVVNLEFINANKASTSLEHQTASNLNFFRGNNQSKWVSHARVGKKIVYDDLYSNIDLEYYQHEGNLKYDFVLNPGAHIPDIHLKYKGCEHIGVNRKGELEIQTPWGVILEEKPYSYQIINGEVHEVDIRYQLRGQHDFGFKAEGPYDQNFPLIIDPIVKEWATWYGGAPTGHTSYIYAVAIDPAGYTYGAGKYEDTFPVSPGVFQSTYGGGPLDGFVVKFSPDNSQLIYASFIGGKFTELVEDIAVNDKGELYAVGYTGTPNTTFVNDFPTTAGAIQPNPIRKYDGFISKISADGTQLLYSSYLGGSGDDYINGVTIAPGDEAVIIGSATINYPTTAGALSTTINGPVDVVVSRINSTGTNFVYSTFIGGSGYETGLNIALGPNEDPYLAIKVNSADFPTTPGTLRTFKYGMQNRSDMGVVRLNANASTIVTSTFVGGQEDDTGLNAGIDVDDQGNVYIGSTTRSPDFPTTAGAMDRQLTDDPANQVITDGYICKLTPDLKQFVWSTFIGGNEGDDIDNIKVNSDGQVFYVGYTSSRDFPTTSCGFRPFPLGLAELVFGVLAADGSKLDFGTYQGGSYNEYHSDIDIREIDNCFEEVALSVTSHSVNFPILNPYQPSKLNGQNIDQPIIMNIIPVINPDFEFTEPECEQPVQFTDLTEDQCIWKEGIWKPTEWEWDFGDGGTSTEQNPQHTYPSAGSYQVRLIVHCPTDTVYKTVVVPSDPSLEIDLGPDLTTCDGSDVTITATGTATEFNWSTGATSQSITANQSDTIWVEGDNGSGCPITDTIIVNIVKNPEVTIEDEAICDGDTAFLSAGNPGATYEWSTGETTQNILALDSGLYKVTVTYGSGGECSATDSAYVNVTPLPIVKLPDTLICGGEVTISAGEYPGATYTWSNGATTESITVSVSGTYAVVVDINGCKGEDFMDLEFINKPIIVDMDVHDVCIGEDNTYTDLSPGGTGLDSIISWEWDFGDGETSTVQNPQHTYSEPGVYEVSLVVTNAETCAGRSIDTVYVYANPETDYLPDASCIGTETKLLDQTTVADSSEIISWEWIIPPSDTLRTQNINYTFTDTGQFNVTLITTTEHGCVDSVIKPIIIYPLPNAAFASPQRSCAPLAVDFVDQSNVDNGTIALWEWNLGDGTISTEQNPSHTYTEPGVYNIELVITSDFRCMDTLSIDSFIIVYPSPTANFEANPWETIISFPSIDFTDLSSSDADQWVWDLGDGNTSSVQNPSHNYNDTGYYQVKLIVANEYGCLDTIVKQIRINPEFAFYVPNVFTPNNKDLKNDGFVGKGIGVKDHEMWIYDRWGNMIYYTDKHHDDPGAPWKGLLSDNTLAPTDTYVYLVKITDVFGDKHHYIGHASIIR